MPGSPPREPGIAALLPPSLLRERSKLERSAANSLAANRTEQNGTKIRIRDLGWGDQSVKHASTLIQSDKLNQGGDCDHRGRSGRLRMNHNRSGTPVKRCVWQVDVGQHEDQQHEKGYAAEDKERRRFDVPVRH